MVIDVAVIGAGAAGLCAVRHLASRPSTFSVTAFEQGEKVGGTWVYTEKTGTDAHGLPIHSSMFKNLKVSRERWTRPTICTWPLVLLSTLSLSIGTFLFIRFHRVPLAAVVKEPELNDGYWAESTYDSVLSAYSVDSGIDDEFMVIPPSLPPGKSHPPSEALKQVILGLADFPDEEYLVQNESLFVPRETVVNSYTPEYIIQAQELCEADGPFLLVAVPSIRNHTIRRKAIRKTWAGPGYGSPWPRKTLRHSVKVVFFFGTGVEGDKDVKLEAEAKLYGDIVQADFVDTYRNLTLKMAAVLHWTANHCPGARHVIKVDEDTIVNLPLLVDVLELVSAHQGRYVMGYKHLSKQPIVIREGRWKVDEDAYPLSVFPNYLYGHSYVISGDAVQELLSAYQRMPSVPTEDAFFTGILAKAVGLSRIHSNHFAHPTPTDYRYNKCALINDHFISHTGFWRANILYQLWKNATDPAC